MTSLCKNLTMLLLFLVTSPLPNSHFFTNGAITPLPPVTHHRISYSSLDEYDDDDEIIPKKTTPVQRGPLQPCKYDPCSEDQEPCDSLSEKLGCLCPGVSRDDKPPHAPVIQALQPISTGADSGKVEVQWCAPSSVVSGYRVLIEGSEGTVEYKEVSRRGVIKSVEVGTKVCVVAVNKAGSSTPTEFSCKRFDHHDSSDHKLLVGVIVGGIALLLILITAAVIIWKYKMQKNAKGDSSDGLGNPSYSTEGTL